MFQEPYQTTALRVWDKDHKLQHELERAFIEGELTPIFVGDRETDILALMPGQKEIAQLWAPIMIDTRQGKRVVFDARNSARMDHEGKIIVNQPLDYNFLQREAALTYIWATEGPAMFGSVKELGMKVFARWFSEGLGFRYGLDPKEQVMLAVMAAYYYQCLFVPATDAPEMQMGTIAYIARVLGVSLDQTNAILKGSPDFEIPYFADLNAFTAYVRKVGGPRFEVFTAAHIYNAMGGSWFGGRAKTIIPCALEYPPTFLVMVYTAFVDRSYLRCYFTKIAEGADRNKQLRQQFISSMARVSRSTLND